MNDDLVIQARGLTRVYGAGASAVTALNGVDLEMAPGELLAVVGVSGSGKSTLLHLIAGLDRATSGSLRVLGRELGELDSWQRSLYRRQVVGMVFQAFHLIPSMTALANVEVALTLQGTYGADRRKRALEALARVGLSARVDHRPGELSGGEQQRVALARAVVHRPSILLADEPTGNLDRQSAAGVMEQIREINADSGTTVVWVTHDEDSARRMASRVVRMRDGRVVEG